MKKYSLLILLACAALVPGSGWHLAAQELTANRPGPATADAAASYVVFEVPGAANCEDSPTCVSPVGVDSQGGVAGNYLDNSYQGHGFYRASDGSVITFDAPGVDCPSGAPYVFCTRVTAISSTGNIVGIYATEGGGAFLRSPTGTFTNLVSPDGSVLGPTAINSTGTITGTYIDVNDPERVVHGFVRDPLGNFVSFDAPNAGADGTLPSAINSRGEIVGTGSYATVFLRRVDGKIVILPPSGGVFVAAIDDGGRVTGSANAVGFLLEPDGSQVNFSVPGAPETFVAGIDAVGTVVGNYQYRYKPSFGYLFHGYYRLKDGTLKSFDPPGSIDTEAAAVGPQGFITGYFYDKNFNVHAFLRKP